MSEENLNEINEINETSTEHENTNEAQQTPMKEAEQAPAAPECEQTAEEADEQPSQSHTTPNGNPNFNPYAYYNPYAYPPFPYGNPYEAQIKPKKKKKAKGALGVIALILVCVIFAGGAGIGGAILANKYLIYTDGTPSTQQGTQNPNRAPVTINKVESSVTENTTLTDVIASVRDTVVEIVTENIQESQFYGKYVTSGAGSGVIISSDGYIITNNHVIEGANSIYVRTTDGTEYEAKMVGTDAESDIGVIKIEATDLKSATFGNSDDLKLGEEVIAIGNPLGSLGGTVTNGIISALNRQITIDGNEMLLLQTNAAVNPGNSGGGLFNMQGHLIGIVNAKSSSSSSGATIEGLGFAIPINHAQSISADLIEHGYVRGRIVLGITFNYYDKDYTYNKGWQTYVIKAGVYVKEPGKNTELQSGDRFVTIDGVTISTSTDIKDVLATHSIGDKIEATVARVVNEKETVVTVTLTCFEQVPEGVTE